MYSALATSKCFASSPGLGAHLVAERAADHSKLWCIEDEIGYGVHSLVDCATVGPGSGIRV